MKCMNAVTFTEHKRLLPFISEFCKSLCIKIYKIWYSDLSKSKLLPN